jgi:outer membrane protein assembly factor BamA
MNKKLLAAATVLILCTSLPGVTRQAGREEKAAEEKEPPPERSVGLVVLPLFFYEPETHLAGGIGGLLTFRTGTRVQTSRPSSMFFYAIYTQLNQFQAQAEPNFYFGGEDKFLAAKLLFERYPNKFWGYGGETPDSAKTDYTPRRFLLEASFQKRLSWLPHLYGGVQYQFETAAIVGVGPEEGLPLSDFAGGRGGTVSGLGLILNWDTRNNIFVPSHGNYVQLSFVANAKAFGGSFNFIALKADVRHYLPGFIRSHAVAFQFLYQSATGNPPFYRYALIGGDSILRGYYKGRYRDKYLLVVQSEYRLPVWWKFGLVGFIGLGNVGPSLGRIDFRDLKYSLGAGLRFKLSPREGANARMDFAFGKGSTGLYFTAGEAF